MKTTFVNLTLNYLSKSDLYTEKDKKIFKYTLESIYSLITKTSVVILLSLMLKTFDITILIILMYSILRGLAFGIHASKNIYCWIVTLSVYSFGPLFIKYINLPILVINCIYIVSLLAIMLWAPSDTPSRPLLDKKKRKANKILATVFSLILISISFYINKINFYEIVSFVLLLEAICICPLTYKLFNVPYKNYLSYNK